MALITQKSRLEFIWAKYERAINYEDTKIGLLPIKVLIIFILTAIFSTHVISSVARIENQRS